MSSNVVLADALGEINRKTAARLEIDLQLLYMGFGKSARASPIYLTDKISRHTLYI